MTDSHRALVERLYDAFNRRDVAAMTELCDERMEFRPITAAEMGRDAPYVGPAGLDEYLHDIASVWDELLILPKQLESRGDRILVRGRVYLRSHMFGIRDLPAAWVWEVKGGRFVGGEVFVDPEEAAARFAADAGP
ncbi:MAG TPA: nuclear transport factor 2 family protein [Solirubrobacterales bacterium]|nr:nuclear transport factor 2 family protein [Solirubrobacterales bacterium]